MGSARAGHLEGLLELGFCRLDPSIGWVKPKAQASGLRLGLGSSSEFGGSTHHYQYFFLFVETTFELRFKKAIKSSQSTISYTQQVLFYFER